MSKTNRKDRQSAMSAKDAKESEEKDSPERIPAGEQKAAPQPPDELTQIEVEDDGARTRLTTVRPPGEIASVGRRGPGGEPKRYRVSWWPNPPDEDAAHRVIIELPFQDGVVTEAGHNGLTNEALLEIVADRLEWFQKGPFPCKQNEHALARVKEALAWLDERTRERVGRQVEGQYVP